MRHFRKIMLISVMPIMIYIICARQRGHSGTGNKSQAFAVSIGNKWYDMMIPPLQTHSYRTIWPQGNGWWTRFNGDDKMKYKYIHSSLLTWMGQLNTDSRMYYKDKGDIPEKKLHPVHTWQTIPNRNLRSLCNNLEVTLKQMFSVCVSDIMVVWNNVSFSRWTLKAGLFPLIKCNLVCIPEAEYILAMETYPLVGTYHLIGIMAGCSHA